MISIFQVLWFFFCQNSPGSIFACGSIRILKCKWPHRALLGLSNDACTKPVYVGFVVLEIDNIQSCRLTKNITQLFRQMTSLIVPLKFVDTNENLKGITPLLVSFVWRSLFIWIVFTGFILDDFIKDKQCKTSAPKFVQAKLFKLYLFRCETLATGSWLIRSCQALAVLKLHYKSLWLFLYPFL